MVTGGQNVMRLLRTAAAADGVDSVDVGFFESAKYPDGTPVAAVAGWQEFGTRRNRETQHVPERPFFRQALFIAEPGVVELVRRRVNSETLVVDDRLADEIGVYVQGEIQQRISDLRRPPNAPITVKGGWMRSASGKAFFVKGKGSTNPLIDTAAMRTAVTFRVNQAPKVMGFGVVQ